MSNVSGSMGCTWCLPQVDPQRVRWYREDSVGRSICWAIILALVGIVLVLKYGGVRDAMAVSGGVIVRSVLGWTPSYLTSLALPFVWPAIGRWAIGRPGSVEFLPECLMGGGLVFVLEVLDLTDSSKTFAWSDVAAVIAGSLTAFLVYRFAVRVRGSEKVRTVS